MRVVERARITPSCCVICRTTYGPFVETGRTLRAKVRTPWSGRVYVCGSCVTQAANELGIIEEAVAPVREEYDAALEELGAVKEENEALSELRSLLDRFAPEKPAPKRKAKSKPAAPSEE